MNKLISLAVVLLVGCGSGFESASSPGDASTPSSNDDWAAQQQAQAQQQIQQSIDMSNQINAQNQAAADASQQAAAQQAAVQAMQQ